jgi:DNA-directed RNA polymerase specialized sigma24 family protein
LRKVALKGWLARVAANTVLRGEHPGNRLALWSRWFAASPTIDESRFQGPDEPYPGHWREFPAVWPAIEPGEHTVKDALASGLDELPRTWRDVVIARDIRKQSAAQVSEQHGVTAEQQRAILNRARAALRERLARRLLRADEE